MERNGWDEGAGKQRTPLVCLSGSVSPPPRPTSPRSSPSTTPSFSPPSATSWPMRRPPVRGRAARILPGSVRFGGSKRNRLTLQVKGQLSRKKNCPQIIDICPFAETIKRQNRFPPFPRDFFCKQMDRKIPDR